MQAVSRGRGRVLLVYWLCMVVLVALAMVVCGCYGCVVLVVLVVLRSLCGCVWLCYGKSCKGMGSHAGKKDSRKKASDKGKGIVRRNAREEG